MAITDIKKLKELLDLEISNNSNVFIVAHNNPDFDALGSSLGLARLVKEYNKKVYIIIDDLDSSLQSGVKKMIDEHKKEYKFIKKKDIDKLLLKKSLLIVTDVNKDNMISIGDKLDLFNSIIVIDHHSENEHTINTENKFINLDVSSASEVVARILSSLKIKCDSNISNALLAGICLDTKRFKQNTTSKTHDVAEKLINSGADIDYVNNLFLEEFESFCRISNLIVNGTVIKKYSESLLAPINVSFTLNRNNPKQVYSKEDYAKAADRMMKFYGIDASFALGYIEDGSIHISARSGKKVNVGDIMHEMNGGGNSQSAGCRVEDKDLLEVEEELMNIIGIGISDDEKLREEPKVIKVKQLKKNKKSE